MGKNIRMGQGTVMFNFYRKGLLGFIFIIALRGGGSKIFLSFFQEGGEIIVWSKLS